MPDFRPRVIPLSRRAAELAEKPDAPRWAGDCGWIPGTGHCGNFPCSPDCLFRAQREAEAERIAQLRQRRRSAEPGRPAVLATRRPRRAGR